MRITWFGHSCFRVEAEGKVVLFDPFLTQNPLFKGTLESATAGVTHLVLTHGHGDHTGDAPAIIKAQKPRVFCNYELGEWLVGQGSDGGLFEFMNTGGSVQADGVMVTLVRADHSSAQGGASLGSANGAVVRIGGQPGVWHLGDTDIFSDMALIAELHQPAIAFVPVGDRFTMGGRTAAIAVRRFMPGVRHVLPCHYGTFGLLAPTADAFATGLTGWDGQLHLPAPGGTVDI